MNGKVEGARKALIVGLTGGIGSGKSTAAQCFRRLGVPVIDADEISREIVEPGKPALQRLVDALGPGILDSHGRLDRAALRHLIFSDPAIRQRVERILHPAIVEEMLKRASRVEAPYCILSIPLLIEANLQQTVDRILVIDSPEELQRQRLERRAGWTPEEIGAAIRAQIGREERLGHADDVIVNDGDLSTFERAVEQIHRRYLAIASSDR
jgi:dephospho-CoA kinase